MRISLPRESIRLEMSVVDDIRSRLDIVDVVSGYIALQRAGRNYKAPCPFHHEKTPSFIVFPDSQTWRCFGACGEGGDIFSFVMKYDGLDFAEALRVLAQRAGVELKALEKRDVKRETEDQRLHTLLDEAAEFYMHLLLTHKAAAPTRAYVARRGLTETTIRQFKLGFAPDAWNTAFNHFRQQGYHESELLEVGLLSKNEEKGTVYDRFRHRLMIPIRDGQGHTVGFGARALRDEDNPKYLNSPQNRFFDKSHLLFGMDMARRTIRETEIGVVVEGYMDVIQAHQAGYTNVVAQMGTALTSTQVQQLAKYARRLVLALDSDAAGINATMRGLNVAHESLTQTNNQTLVFDAQGMLGQAGRLQLDIRVLRLPTGKDPDDFIREHPDEWQGVVENAQPLVDYIIDAGTRHLKPSSDIFERTRTAQQLLPLLTATENDMQRNQNIQRLALRLNILEKDLLGMVKTGTPTVSAPPLPNKTATGNWKQAKNGKKPAWQIQGTEKAGTAGVQRGLQLERYCLWLLMQRPEWLFEARGKLRELASQDLLAAEVLSPLGKQDFTREDHRMLFTLIEEAVMQDSEEPGYYIQSHLPEALVILLREIEVLVTGLAPEQMPALYATELKSIVRDHSHLSDPLDIVPDKNEFLNRTLALREEYLKREETEYYFLVREAHAHEFTPEMEAFVQKRFTAYARAKRLLRTAMETLGIRRQNDL